MAVVLSLAAVLGLAAGALIVGVGVFILAAQPRSWIHRLFLALAIADGVGTILFRLRDASTTLEEAYFYMSGYWDMEIAFVALLLAFFVLFPRPPARARVAAMLLVTLLALAAFLLALFQARPEWFWSGATSATGTTAFRYAPGGDGVYTAFVLVTGLVIVRLTRAHFREASASYRTQGAFLLGGMLLANAPYVTTIVVNVILHDPARYLFTGRGDIIVAVWARLVVFVAMVACGVAFALDRAPERRADARIALAGFGGLVALTAIGGFDGTLVTVCRMLGLVAYPVLLAYAILRFELFDIDARLRRAATATLALGALAALFVIAQNMLQGLLQETVLGGVPSAWASGTLAALATAGVSVPIVRLSRRVGRRVVPELTHDDLHRRKLEVYRHSVEGALADGMVVEKESRMLFALRESLDLTQAEHEAIVADVRASVHA